LIGSKHLCDIKYSRLGVCKFNKFKGEVQGNFIHEQLGFDPSYNGNFINTND